MLKKWFDNFREVSFFFFNKLGDVFIILNKIKLSDIDYNLIVLTFLILLLIALLWYLLIRKVHEQVLTIPSLSSLPLIVNRDNKPRFRRRDKIRYYATRIHRKFQNLTKNVQNIKSKDQKQKLMSIFAKKVLNLKDQAPRLLKRKIPEAFLEPDQREDDNSIPEEFRLVLDSIKVFGPLEKNFIAEFYKNIETISLDKDEILIKIGDLDENVFVVKSGLIQVNVEENEGGFITIREVERGGNITSLLSVLDVIIGNKKKYKTIQAVATMPSEVIRIKAHSFTNMFSNSAETMLRIVQLIALRLQRVTFLSLHCYLGLTSELINKESLAVEDSSVVKLAEEVPSLEKDEIIKQLCDTKDNTKKNVKYNIKRFEDMDLIIHQSDETDSHATTINELELGETPDTVTAGIIRRTSVKDRKKNLSTSSAIPSSSIGIATRQFQKRHDSVLLTAAKSDIAKILGLKDASQLANLKMSIVTAGTSLVKEGEENTDVYFVVTGELHVLQHVVGNEPSKMSLLFVTKPGELCGVEPIITTEPSFYTIKAPNSTRAVVLSRDLLYSLIKNDHTVLFKLSNLLVRRLSPFLRQIDFALEWSSIKAGQPLYKIGDLPKSVYIVLSGRFRQINVKADGSREIVNELGRGELIGFVEVLCQQPRATTFLAIRDSEVAQIPAGLLSWIKLKVPHVVSRLIQLLADKLLISISGQQGIVNGPKGTMGNLRTIAVIPTRQDVPLESFVLELQHAMRNIGSSIRLTSFIIKKRLGAKALDSMNEYRLLSWLSQQEDQQKLVFYVADQNANSIWTKRCVRQADCVMMVALGNKDPGLTEIEQGLELEQTKMSKILVLLYKEETIYPPAGKTSEWLNVRPWITHHFHIRCPKRVFTHRKRRQLVELYHRVFEKEIPIPHSDMSRLARYITGTAIGIVLGGGGARGCSHVGALKALYEAGIPIDMIGGTSIGSFIGALWSEETRITQFTQRARAFSKEMSSWWKILLDLTYSPVSIFSGKGMNFAIENVFKDRQVEDLWIPYFCVTTDITNSKMRTHTHGSLWRFVRASMSLSGYLPPLCHPEDGSLLLDGGYVNNLPADIMNSLMGPEFIFAIDVGSHDDTDLSNYGDWLSGGKLLYNRYIVRNPLKVLNLTEIQSRLAFVSCVRQMEQVIESNICEYMRPPIEKYKTLQFGSFDEIQDVGYKYTKDKIQHWQKENSIPHFSRGQLFWCSKNEFLQTSPTHRKSVSKMKQGPSTKNLILGNTNLDLRRSFIDLAEIVSRIGPSEDAYIDTDSDEELFEKLTKIKMRDHDDESEIEILLRTKNTEKVLIGGSDAVKPGSSRNTTPMEMFSHEQTNENGGGLMDEKDSPDKYDEGYDEDLEDLDNLMDAASDPESFSRALSTVHKRRHRRSSLNRLHKSTTFDQTINDSGTN